MLKIATIKLQILSQCERTLWVSCCVVLLTRRGQHAAIFSHKSIQSGIYFVERKQTGFRALDMGVVIFRSGEGEGGAEGVGGGEADDEGTFRFLVGDAGVGHLGCDVSVEPPEGIN